MYRIKILLIILFVNIFFSEAAIIKKGDVLDIKVLGHPELSGIYAVDERGMIEYPLLSEEPVVNMGTAELMNLLMFRLAKHLENPLVTVSVVDKPEIIVTVLGQVVTPGPVKTFDGASIQEVLKGAGGPIPGVADLSRIKIVRGDKSAKEEIFNLDSFLINGDVAKLPKLHSDDMVIVLGLEKSKKVKVIGAVQRPGLFTLEEKMNLFEVIYLAGGPTEKADLSRIRRFTHQKGGTVTEEILDLQGFIDKGKMENIPEVNEGDVIIVYSKWFDWKTLMTILNNTLLFIVTIQAFAGIFK